MLAANPVGEFLEPARLVAHLGERTFDGFAGVPQLHTPVFPIQPSEQLSSGMWGGPGWKVFIDTERQLRATIRYIEENPIKARRPAQKWDFVTPYDGWLPGLHPDRRNRK